MTNFKPSGYRVLVRLEEVEQTSAGGIILHTESEKQRQQRGHDIGVVVAVGPEAWRRDDLNSTDTPWCREGQKVMFPKYAGHAFQDNERWYHVMNDEDILGVFE